MQQVQSQTGQTNVARFHHHSLTEINPIVASCKFGSAVCATFDLFWDTNWVVLLVVLWVFIWPSHRCKGPQSWPDPPRIKESSQTCELWQPSRTKFEKPSNSFIYKRWSNRAPYENQVSRTSSSCFNSTSCKGIRWQWCLVCHQSQGLTQFLSSSFQSLSTKHRNCAKYFGSSDLASKLSTPS